MVAGRPRLGTFLIEQQLITDEQLDEAMQQQMGGMMGGLKIPGMF